MSCPGYATKCEYTARSLTEGKLYVFRIRAENQIGASDALVGKHIEAKSPYDPPGPPGTPVVEALSPSSATTNWTPPTDTGYFKQILDTSKKRENLDLNGTVLTNNPTSNLNYVIPKLREGARYEFRVLAYN